MSGPSSGTPSPGEAPADASAELVVGGEHGLHMRPAADFVRLASRFRSDLRLSNATRGKGREANARSLLEITALGIDSGHTIRLTARGEDAEQAVSELSDLVRSFGA